MLLISFQSSQIGFHSQGKGWSRGANCQKWQKPKVKAQGQGQGQREDDSESESWIEFEALRCFNYNTKTACAPLARA